VRAPTHELGTSSFTRPLQRFVSRHHANYVALWIVAQKEALTFDRPRRGQLIDLPTEFVRSSARLLNVMYRKV
jgi:hypothetical protein